MMQSILSTNSVKPQNNERLSGTSPLEVEATANSLEAKKGGIKSRFSDLFDSLLAGDGKKNVDKERGNKDLLVEGNSDPKGQVDCQPLIECSSDHVDSEVVSENIDDQLADATEKKEQEILGAELVSEPVKNVVYTDNVESVKDKKEDEIFPRDLSSSPVQNVVHTDNVENAKDKKEGEIFPRELSSSSVRNTVYADNVEGVKDKKADDIVTRELSASPVQNVVHTDNAEDVKDKKEDDIFRRELSSSPIQNVVHTDDAEDVKDKKEGDISPRELSSSPVQNVVHTDNAEDVKDKKEGDISSRELSSSPIQNVVHTDNAEDVKDKKEGEISSRELSFSPVQNVVYRDNVEGVKDKKEDDIFPRELPASPVQNVVHTDNEEGVKDKKEEDLDNLDSDIKSVVIQQSDLSPRIMGNKAEDKLSALVSEKVDQNEDGEGVVGQNQTAILAQPSIIEQIEAAKKIDTQVIGMKKMAKVDSAPPELASQIQKGQGQEKESSRAHESLFADESSLFKKSEAGTTSAADSLKTETAQAILNKIEPFSLANSSETDRGVLTSPVDASTLRTANMDVSNLNKSINQNLAAATQSAALDQPLELQAKHASALLGERILMMIKESKQEVSIRLDPAELGSMHIKLQVQHDQVQLTIHTQVAQSRDIIEQNLPRLREQLAQQGVSLGETSVEQQSQQQNQNHEGKNGSQERGIMSVGDSSLQAMTDKTEWIASKIALPAQGIDYYA